jgi:uracil-DNA glycosylase
MNVIRHYFFQSAVFNLKPYLCIMRPMEQISEIDAILRFYLEAGVDETIGDAPINRFETSKTRQPPKAATPVSTPKRVETPLKKAPGVNLAEGVRSAEQISGDCHSIDELRKALETFEGCSLKKMATNTVFANGNPAARLMIIDRPPSVEEDRSGFPFSGEAGGLLEIMLEAIGVGFDDTYRTSVLPWRPPGGRQPTTEELSLCLPFIHRHIELARPELILLCGEAAAFLHRQKKGINKLRGTWLDYKLKSTSTPTLAIFHPAFLLDHPASKKYAWTDMLSLKAAMGGSK